MYGFSMPAKVISIEENKSVAVEWGEGNDASVIEWILTPRNDETTYVHINNYGFKGGLSAVVKQAIDSTEGFTFYLAGMKAYLEHGVRLNLVQDKFPDGLPG
jgi:uncharacterized protein YndB with AHSA1/START domain